MVFYRKYRPQTIDELDSKEVRDKLHSVLESSEISHAFLFTGPKGLGKTSTARIIAKALNCEGKGESGKGKDKKNLHSSPLTLNANVEPCNKCDQCKSITNGTNLDILEIDGASNRGIDEIRDLREKVKLSPISARKKVYIIDEVHMLTTEAFNALLKTLEEPPSHVVFILCTTESHKVPDTILSRCLRIQFKKATRGELVRSFERIIKKEGLIADKEALSLIAGLSDGSFRDGVKILEEMAQISKDGKITKDLIESKHKISSMEYQIAQMIRNFENKETKSALEGVAKLVGEGIDIGHFMQNLIESLHNSLLLKAEVQNLSERLGFAAQTSLEMGEVKKLIELLSKAYGELKYAVLPQIPLELVIVEWGLAVVGSGPVRSFPPANAPSSSSVRVVGSPSSSATRPPLSATRLPDVPLNVTQQDMTKYSENDALWNALIDKVKAYNHSIAGVLRGCRIKSYDNKSLILETNFKFHKDKLSEPKTQEILNKTIKDVTKKNVRIEVVLKSK
ncbi:MAG: DNA polymerase III subunit gamma/tau [Candidatus Levybacteria bacterium]|nr:DNA polymerase III subunit gamma/tau [Candidatus Levybacteria bacterium]